MFEPLKFDISTMFGDCGYSLISFTVYSKTSMTQTTDGPFIRGWFELDFESLGNSSDTVWKQMFRDNKGIFLILSIMKMYAVWTY